MMEEAWGWVLALVGLMAIIVVPAPWYFFIALGSLVAIVGLYVWWRERNERSNDNGKEHNGTE